MQITLALMVAVTVGALVMQARQRAMTDAESALRSLALILADQAERAFEAVDLAQTTFLEMAQTAGITTADGFRQRMSSLAVNREMTDHGRALPQLDVLGLVDADGRVINLSHIWPSPNNSIAERPYFKALRSDPDRTSIISEPFANHLTHTQAVVVAHRISAPDGSFIGISFAGVLMSYFEKLYQTVANGEDRTISLFRSDGMLLSRYPARQASIGRIFPEAGSLAAAGVKTERRKSPVDGLDRLVTVHALARYPMAVLVSTPVSSILKSWRKQAVALTGGAVILELVMAAAALLTLRQIRGQQMLAEARAGEARKSLLLETTLAHMSQGILLIDGAQRVQVCNQQAIEKLGLDAAVMATRPLFTDVLRWIWHQAATGPSVGPAAESLADFMKSAAVSDRREVHDRVTPSGTVLEICSTPLPGGGVVRTYTDITASRQNEAMLRAARDRAHEAARAKSEFLATMSHEIRSPMSGLVGVLDLLRETGLDPDQEQMVGMVQGSAATLLAVLNDILDFSKIEAGALQLVLEPARLRELVGELARPYAVAAARKGVELTVWVSPDTPEQARVDSLRLRQILGNLLSNAIKFTAAGAVTLRLDLGPDAASLRFSVADTGIGMTPDVLGRLFEPFMQADGSTTRNFGGTGLGLCISQRLAALQGGTLSAASTAGQGSVFTLLLPLDVGGAPPAVETAPAALPLAALAGRVLVADDDPTNRWIAQRQLQLLGLDVATAVNGQEALDRLRAGRFDLLLTDCHMPVMNGPALARAVRNDADPTLRNIPVIGLTADVTEGQRDECQQAGMSELAIKPLSRALLAALLSRHLPGAEPGPPPPESGDPPRPALAFDASLYWEIFVPGEPDGEAWLAEYQELADRLIDDLRPLLGAEPEVPNRRDLIRATAHRLAGAALSAGATRLGEAARALEHAAAGADGAALLQHAATLQREATEAKQAIAHFITELNAAHAL